MMLHLRVSSATVELRWEQRGTQETCGTCCLQALVCGADLPDVPAQYFQFIFLLK